MPDRQPYQSRVASEEETSPVPTHGDPRQTDDPDPTSACEKLGKTLRGERAQPNHVNSAENVPGNHDEIIRMGETKEATRRDPNWLSAIICSRWLDSRFKQLL